MTTDSFTLPAIPPLATGARPAGHGEANCAICAHRLGPGQRIADLPDNSPAHISCIATAAAPPKILRRVL